MAVARRANGRRKLERRAAVLGSLLALAASATNCSFPDYDFQVPAGGGQPQAGTAGSSGAPGGSSGAGEASGEGGVGEAAGSGGLLGGAAGAPEAGAGGVAPDGPPCVFPDPVVFPAHCFDKMSNSGESGVDCGGSQCAACSHTEGCLTNSDCAGQRCTPQKTCAPIISLQYTSLDSTASTRAPHFRLQINYFDELPTPLNDLKIRYYFNHNGVSEPVITPHSQAMFDPGGALRDITMSMRAAVFRTLPGPSDRNGRRTDSYVEISFSSFSSLTAGSELVVLQDFAAGGATSFDQATHYSFLNAPTGMVPNNAITVYRGGQRVWGLEPPMNVLPECAFAGAVNVAGRALRINGQAVAAEADEAILFQGSPAVSSPAAKAVPAADAATSTLLTTWRTMGATDSALWTVPNGSYWAFAWLTSGPSATSGTLSIQDTLADPFFGSQANAGAAWGLVGPYPVEVFDQTLSVTASGTVQLAGLKLYRASD